MDQLRYANRLPTVELAPESDNHWIDTAENDLLEMQLQHLAQIMRTVSPDELQMLRMKYEEGMDIKEIAQQLDLRDSAVKMRLKRTRDKIRKLFTEQEF
jgi:RNA polymerase sigma-70 factor (ECF subfamily)